MLELLQQILASARKIKVDEDEVVNNIEDQYETVIISDVLVADLNGELSEEAMIVADSASSSIVTGPWQW